MVNAIILDILKQQYLRFVAFETLITFLTIENNNLTALSSFLLRTCDSHSQAGTT